MQKDIHFYLSYALARKCGIPVGTAEIIAWSNQHTDELTKAELYGLRTQCGILNDWYDRTVQHDIIIPFHFIPGDDESKPWMVTANSARARALVEAAKDDPFRFGIALHTLQDTFSHQGFSGWQEQLNACYPWYYIQSGLPNIGHAEMGVIPDVVNYVWTDPRTGEVIDNKIRAENCSTATFHQLYQFAGRPKGVHWPAIADEIELMFHLSYDDRKRELRRIGGRKAISYKNLHETLRWKHKEDFIEAARQHLSAVMKSLRT